MILYDPYIAKNVVSPIFRDFLVSSMPKARLLSVDEEDNRKDCEKPNDLGLPFLKLIGKVSVNKPARSVRDSLLSALDVYANGTSLLELADKEPYIFLSNGSLFPTQVDNPFYIALKNDAAKIKTRLEGRIDCFCETENAKAVGELSAWQDIEAITSVFARAVISFDKDFKQAMLPIQNYVQKEVSEAVKKASDMTSLQQNLDYFTP